MKRYTANIADFHGTRNERKRAVYLLVLMQTESRAKARHASGLDPSSEKRLLEKLSTHGDFRDAPRSGRPAKYTEAKMQQAADYLTAHDRDLFNGQRLMDRMQAEQIMHGPVTRGLFLQHLKDHLKQQGHPLQVNSTKTVFYLSDKDHKTRLTFAQSLEANSSARPWDMAIFVDETTKERTPHPKSEATCSPASQVIARSHLMSMQVLNDSMPMSQALIHAS